MNLRDLSRSPGQRIRQGVKRVTPIAMIDDASNAFIAAARSRTHEELAVPRRRPPLLPPNEPLEAAAAEEQLVQELRPLARVLLIQARRELARRAREAQVEAA